MKRNWFLLVFVLALSSLALAQGRWRRIDLGSTNLTLNGIDPTFGALGGFLEVIGANKRIASDLYREKRYSLRCHECDHVREISKQEFAGYLAGGWPKHCGVTMTLESEPR